ncbi:MAG: sensor histidine kinase, partial [Ruminococcaceae bacterium]|nr:sensor histidine kinase [Oscillospiraceae bacterium]
MIEKIKSLRSRASGGVTMKSMLWRMVLIVAMPMMALVLLAVSIEILYATNYNAILNNVTLASEFNQNFKSDVDLKMYYYVIDSQYSEGIPIDEVRSAENLAETLLATTTERESIKAITSVLNLCSNLEDKMYEIAESDSYDERQEHLDNNIYILTGLIEDYMYTYLYHEAAHLKTVNQTMVQRLAVFIAGILLLTFVLTLVLLNRSRKLGDSIAAPINELCSRVRSIGGGDLTVYSPIQADEVEIQTLSNGFEQMVERLNLLMEK